MLKSNIKKRSYVFIYSYFFNRSCLPLLFRNSARLSFFHDACYTTSGREETARSRSVSSFAGFRFVNYLYFCYFLTSFIHTVVTELRWISVQCHTFFKEKILQIIFRKLRNGLFRANRRYEVWLTLVLTNFISPYSMMKDFVNVLWFISNHKKRQHIFPAISFNFLFRTRVQSNLEYWQKIVDERWKWTFLNNFLHFCKYDFCEHKKVFVLNFWLNSKS